MQVYVGDVTEQEWPRLLYFVRRNPVTLPRTRLTQDLGVDQPEKRRPKEKDWRPARLMWAYLVLYPITNSLALQCTGAIHQPEEQLSQAMNAFVAAGDAMRRGRRTQIQVVPDAGTDRAGSFGGFGVAQRSR